MIIKRRATRQFVQLENALVRDRRLTLDEHGMLHYLLSLPNDWEVTQVKCARFWNIGRDKCSRIFRSLRRTGWAQYERLYADDGVTLMGTRWIIGDEPGPEPSAATLATEDETEAVDSPADEPTAAPESQGPDALASSRRETPFPTVGPPDNRVSRESGNKAPKEERKNLEQIDSTNTTVEPSRDDDGEPPPLFGEALRLWPVGNVASAYACERVFAKFTDKMKRDAFNGIKPYLEDCRAKGHNRICDLRTYLDERRFERFVNKPAGRSLFVVKRGTPQAMRWREHFDRFAPHRLPMFEETMRTRGEYTTESEWPPPLGRFSKSA